MSVWYRNHYGATRYNNIVENKKGYFLYDITLTSKRATDILPRNFNVQHGLALHNVISYDELSYLLNDHWVQENHGNYFSGKIAVNSELNYKQILQTLKELFRTNLYDLYKLTEDLDYLFSELGYIDSTKLNYNFNENYWLVKYPGVNFSLA